MGSAGVAVVPLAERTVAGPGTRPEGLRAMTTLGPARKTKLAGRSVPSWLNRIPLAAVAGMSEPRSTTICWGAIVAGLAALSVGAWSSATANVP